METKIIIWDSNPERIAACYNNISLAMKELRLKLPVEIMSEPPLISRAGLTGRLPSLEINGNYWTWKTGEIITKEAACSLLRHVLLDNVKKTAV
ncbi:MAG: hypothetical protein ACLTZ2_05630 [Desulfovibrio sp.]